MIENQKAEWTKMIFASINFRLVCTWQHGKVGYFLLLGALRNNYHRCATRLLNTQSSSTRSHPKAWKTFLAREWIVVKHRTYHSISRQPLGMVLQVISGSGRLCTVASPMPWSEKCFMGT